MEPEIQPEAVPGRIKRRTYVIRCAIATAVVLATFIYLIGIALGRVPQQQRLGAADVWMIVVAALAVGVLVRPELLNRLTHLKVGGVEIDWFHKLQADQQKQRDELDDARFVLT